MLKESISVLFGGERWGPTRKGRGPSWRSGFRRAGAAVARSGRARGRGAHDRSPDGSHRAAEHARLPRVTSSSPVLECSVLAVRDSITPEQWADIWVHAPENGSGTLRSQGLAVSTSIPASSLPERANCCCAAGRSGALNPPGGRPLAQALPVDHPSLRRPDRPGPAHPEPTAVIGDTAAPAARTDHADSCPGATGRGSGRWLRSLVAGMIAPSARSHSYGLPVGSLDSNATGRPRSVISMLSRLSTRRSNSLARRLSSCVPTLGTC